MTVVLLAAAALIGAGCGDSGDDDEGTTATSSQTATQPAPAPDAGGTPKAKRVKPKPGEARLGRKPKPSKGAGSAPSNLVVQDLIRGNGKKAASGDTVSVRYVGVLFDDGKEFDASWQGDRPGKPFQFPLGAGQVIPGWDQGVVGMRVGGRRKLIIPPDLAYGAQGYPPQIPPNAALIFDIDLLKVD
jgi:peptidylprolyl isomerase